MSKHSGFWVTDRNHRFTTATMDGDTLHEIIGLTRMEFVEASVDTQLWQSHIADLEDAKPFSLVYADVRPGDLRARWTVTTGIPVFGKLRRFEGYKGHAVMRIL